MRQLAPLAGALALLAVTAFSTPQELRRALETITAPDLRAHLRFLSHDLLQGRAPGTAGGRTAELYIAGEFERAGLDGVGVAHLQPVPLLGLSLDTARLELEFRARGRSVPFTYHDEVLLWPGVEDAQAAADGEIVFVGYGVRAPEYRWDDFKDAQLQGKILLFLVGDPPAPPDEPRRFDGRAMTYYGRWNYKVEEAERLGAAGALLIHTPWNAGYPWSVVQGSWSGEQLSLPRSAGQPAPLPLHGWLAQEFAARLLDAAGLDLAELHVQAARRDFRPVPTGITLRARMPVLARRLESANVVGLLRGRDPELAREVVVLTAHHDHLGIGPAVDGDSIYNGAYDNASGVALLLEIAQAFTTLESRPRRSLLFIATAAEEAGLLGATHYVRNPLVPLTHTVAAINLDGANLWGETDDVTALGAERSTLARTVEARARQLGMTLVPDRAPELGLFFRSDHFAFARAGIPALLLDHGIEFRGRPDGWGAAVLDEWAARHYHRPSDEYRPDLQLAGAIQQARLAFLVAYDIAESPERPAWLEPGQSPAVR